MESGITAQRRLRLTRRIAWAAQAALFVFILTTPFDNLIEIPHGVFRLLRGDSHPFDAWKAFTPVSQPPPPLDVRSMPRISAMEHAPFTGWYRLALIALFLWFQWEFVRLARGHASAWTRRLLIPASVFGLYFGAILGTWYLTVLDYGGRLQSADNVVLRTLRMGGWKAALLGGWTESVFKLPADLNRPWVYVLMAIAGAGAFWAAAVIFRRRGPREGGSVLVWTLFVSSAVSIFVAGPVDIAARTSEPSSFLTGTFVSLLVAVPMFLWTLWPLTEVLLGIGLNWLRTFVRVDAGNPAARDAGDYVARAHTMSLAILGLGLAGWQIGLLHSNRTRLMTEARELIAVELLRSSNLKSNLDSHMEMSGRLAPYSEQRRERLGRWVLPDGKVYTEELHQVSGFPGELASRLLWSGDRIQDLDTPRGTTAVLLEQRELPVIGTVLPLAFLACTPPSRCPGGYLAVIRGHGEGSRDFLTGIFRLDDTSIRRRLQEIGRDLDLPPDALPETRASDGSLPAAKWEIWMERIYRRLYNWSVNVPLVEGLTLSTTTAIWAISIVMAFALTVLRNCLTLSLQSVETDIKQPWLLLDAELPAERFIAALWLITIPFCGMLVSSALLVATSESFRVGTDVSLGWSLLSLGGILAVTAVNLWTAVVSVLAIVALRRARVAELERQFARKAMAASVP